MFESASGAGGKKNKVFDLTPSEKYQRKNSGEIRRGRNSGICGQVMIAASTSSIGTSMIIVSLSA